MNSYKTKTLVVLVFASILLCSCNHKDSVEFTPESTQYHISRSLKARILEPDTGHNDMETLVESNTIFAFKLYHALSVSASDSSNLFFCPYSISLALAMTYAGARGETESQIAQCLHFNLSRERLHPAFNALDLALSERGQVDQNHEGLRLTIANSTWGQDGYTFVPDFLDTLALNYGAGMFLLDFAKNTETSLKTINEWVETETNSKIQDLLAEGSLDSATRLVLVNVVYFNAAWARRFDEDNTVKEPFYLLDRTHVMSDMMYVQDEFAYTRQTHYQAIELPYVGNELSMIIILPDEGRFESVEQSLETGTLETITDYLFPARLTLKMPRFEYKGESTSLKQILSAMGMPVAFTTDADLSGISGSQKLFIDDVIHKAYVKVDEKGTEAAAATGVVVALTSAATQSLTVNRPFIFLIRDIPSGTVLFMGRIMNPGS